LRGVVGRFGIIFDPIVISGYLGKTGVSVRKPMFLGLAVLVVVFLTEQILGSTGDRELGVDFNGFLFQGETGEGVDKELIKLFIDIILDIFLQYLIL
jgi:hypothetical protein